MHLWPLSEPCVFIYDSTTPAVFGVHCSCSPQQDVFGSRYGIFPMAFRSEPSLRTSRIKTLTIPPRQIPHGNISPAAAARCVPLPWLPSGKYKPSLIGILGFRVLHCLSGCDSIYSSVILCLLSYLRQIRFV